MASDTSVELGMRLLQACTRADLNRVRSLLRLGADPSFPGPAGQTPLHSVVLSDREAKRDDVAVIAELVQAGAAVDAANARGATPLMLAAAKPILQTALLAAGANPNLTDRNGDTDLVWAVSVNKAASIEHLISAGANVSQVGSSGRGPLAYAAYRGNLNYMRSLLAAGAQIDPKDSEGMTPLMVALSMRHHEAALALADAGADLRARDRRGRSVIWFAARCNDAPILRRAEALGVRLTWLKRRLLRLQGLLAEKVHR